jgi:exopolysaccharide biosynthesis WecB/TagA/CpsF family protein/anti-anti-sigma factor
MSNRITLLGMGIDRVRLSDAVDRIRAMIRQYTDDGRARYVATVNVDFIVNTLGSRPELPRHPELLAALREADLVTADGMPIVWLSRLLKTPLPERVTGADLVPALAGALAAQNGSMFLLGGREGIAERAAAILQKNSPGLQIVGCSAPFVNTDGPALADADAADAKIVEVVNAAKPDVLLLAFGNPKQELWYRRNRHRLQVPVSIGIGGTFEFIAGTVRRAPRWMRGTGLEWVYRITQDPRRLWKRYVVGLGVFGLISWRTLKASHGKASDEALPVGSVTFGKSEQSVTLWRGTLAKFEEAPSVERLILDLRGQSTAGAARLADLAAWLRNRTARQHATIIVADASFERKCRGHRLIDVIGRHLVSRPEKAWRQIAPTIGNYGFTDDRLFIAGEFDAPLANELESQSELPPTSINLEFCSFIDSAALGFLVRLDRRSRECGRRLRLENSSPIVLQSLRVSRLDQYFDCGNGAALADQRELSHLPAMV